MTIHTEEKPLACEKCDGLLGGLLQGWKLSLQIRPQITRKELLRSKEVSEPATPSIISKTIHPIVFIFWHPIQYQLWVPKNIFSPPRVLPPKFFLPLI